MNSMLATEVTTAPTALETWSANERMRHIPSLEWMIRKVDVDVRRRVDLLLGSFTSPGNEPHRAALDEGFRNLVRGLDRLAEVARHSRTTQQSHDTSQRVHAALQHAVENLRSLDADLIGRRFPFHTSERSKAEPLYGALLAVLDAVGRLVPLVRAVDPGLDERLLEGLVVLQNPVDERMLRPIA